MKTVVEQLETYCDCLPNLSPQDMNAYVNEMIHLISNVTCWAQEPCETFLNSERTEMIDFGTITPCDDPILRHTPFYKEVKTNTIKVVVVEVDGIHDHKISLDSDKYAYSKTHNEIRIDVSDFVTNVPCEPEIERRVMIGYHAGYETIPECLLPIFCDILHVTFQKNKCDCSACQQCKSDYEDAEDAEDITAFEFYATKLLHNGYQQQLSTISLCRKEPWVWGSAI